MANLSPKQVRMLLRRLGGLDPAIRGNMSERQIRQNSQDYVGAHLNPLRDETSKAIERRSQRGVGAISGYTAEHEHQLDRIPGLVDADYNRQRADEEAASGALSSFLQGRGQQESGALAAKLQAAGIEAPATDPRLVGPPDKAPGPGMAPAPPGPPIHPPPPAPERLSDQPAIFGRGVAGESSAHGFSALSRIGSEGASQRAYAHELPGIAALGGRASARDLELQLNKELGDQLGAINAQAPGMAADQTERLRDRNLGKADRRAAALNAYLDRELQGGIASSGLGFDYAKLGESARQADQRDSTDRAAIEAANKRTGMNLKERARHNGVSEKEQRKRDREAARHNKKMEKKKTGGSIYGP